MLMFLTKEHRGAWISVGKNDIKINSIIHFAIKTINVPASTTWNTIESITVVHEELNHMVHDTGALMIGNIFAKTDIFNYIHKQAKLEQKSSLCEYMYAHLGILKSRLCGRKGRDIA